MERLWKDLIKTIHKRTYHYRQNKNYCFPLNKCLSTVDELSAFVKSVNYETKKIVEKLSIDKKKARKRSIFYNKRPQRRVPPPLIV